MSEEHNRELSQTATEIRVESPEVLLSAYVRDGEPVVVLSTDEGPGAATVEGLLGAVVTALADRRGVSKEAVAGVLADRADRLQAEAIEERRRYEVETADGGDLPFETGDDGEGGG